MPTVGLVYVYHAQTALLREKTYVRPLERAALNQHTLSSRATSKHSHRDQIVGGFSQAQNGGVLHHAVGKIELVRV